MHGMHIIAEHSQRHYYNDNNSLRFPSQGYHNTHKESIS